MIEAGLAPADDASSAGRLDDLEERAFPLLIWAAHTVEQEYFDRDRIDPVAQLLSATTTLGLHTPEFLATVSEDRRMLGVKVGARASRFALDDVESFAAATDRLEEILAFTQSVLDLPPEPLHELEYAAINGLFAPLDPHTILLTPEEHTDLGVRTKGEFGGIGAQIRAEVRRIVVVRVLPGMPAEAAGVKSGDIVLRIGRESTVNMTAQEAQQLLRGPIGSVVDVKVRRGNATLTLPITRDTIHIESVERAMLPDGVAYLRIINFQENTGQQVHEALTELGVSRGEVEAVVLDVRGNSGGLLTQATDVVDQLVARGDLVVVRSALGREADPAHPETSLPPETPVVVLVDEESASASEIVGGGVKALGRGVVLGRTSFGKGTVQMIRPAQPYGRELALKLTVAEYLVAGDQRIQSIGVVPDLELLPVELTPIAGVVRYFDAERFERERERSRTANLASAAHGMELPPIEPPAATLHYLWTADDPAPGRGDEVLPDEMRDPEVRIAQRVALGLRGTTDRAAQLHAMRAAATTLTEDEDARITRALAKTRVDWSPDPRPGPVPPSIEIEAKLAEAGPIGAGEPFVLHVEATNRGTERVHRVHVVTDCVHDELDGIELMVGAIAPGETSVRDIKLHVMPWHTDFTDAVTLDVYVGEPGGEPAAQARVMFEIDGAPQASLSYDAWIVDDPALVGAAPRRPPTEHPIAGEPPFVVMGNGDGMLQPGERVLLAFVAHNDGPGASPDVRAVLRNLSGGQGLLEEGVVPLGPIASGALARGAFGMTVSEEADPAMPFELELIVGDATLRTSAQDKLRFRVLREAPTLHVEPRAFTVEGDPIRMYAGAHPSASVVGEVSVGVRLLARGTLGDYLVFGAKDAGRRTFVPSDLAALVHRGTSGPDELDRVAVRPVALPPKVELEAVPRVTEATVVRVKGIVRHPTRVRDVVVLVRPPGPSQVDRKVYYGAAKGTAGTLAFEAVVPLEPGGNRIVVLARDGAKVEMRRDLWVYRDGK